MKNIHIFNKCLQRKSYEELYNVIGISLVIGMGIIVNLAILALMPV
jgi:hypothetical protein